MRQISELKKFNLGLITAIAFISITSSCEKGIITSAKDLSPATAMKATLSDIQKNVFTPTCATAGCHVKNGTFPNLSDSTFYRIVGVDNSFQDMPLIDNGNSSNSYLYLRITGAQGALMPSGGTKLPQVVLDSIKAWIDNGAKNN